MQSFKQYLLEETGNDIYLNVATAMVDETVPKKFLSRFEEELKLHLKGLQFKIETSYEFFEVSIKISGNTSSNLLSQYVDTIRSVAEDVGDIENGYETVSCVWPPNAPITIQDYPLNIFFQDNVDLKNAAKLILTHDDVILHNCEKLKGILALLKCPTRYIEFNANSNREEIQKVFEIFLKHLRGDRDLLACQEELMDAGLNQYARN